ncbi:transcriptional activator protein acu-15 [Podospora fimiseda]|uniref:Transcriptional activator protein acu-15 n=1 Tax=Podospora fimiseda TaxID=252190 RepID=A0AAN7BY17_9PEZI|nr:transcriptional activator protein acu-15 [Podospora fimiseda]
MEPQGRMTADISQGDRQKPLCSRCSKSGGECVYPESRRKPAFKRRNVRELEERLAQVEDLLKGVGKSRAGQPSASSAGPSAPQSQPTSPGGLGAEFNSQNLDGCFSIWPSDQASPWPSEPPAQDPNAASWELLGLGQFERLPPTQMIEDLHNHYFAAQQHYMPIIHADSYLRAFYSPPHMRPPMCLQYAIWTMAANGHDTYKCYHDALYKRARQYLEADELKGTGEHFITIGHAQAWALIATNEARCMLFTRAALSSARCIRLAGMMGLHRLDYTNIKVEQQIAPMIPAPRNWIELEERRRVFWGAFCIDSYASVSTGWPTAIDINTVTTHLPASEQAFANGKEEKTTPLHQGFNSPDISSFAGKVIMCYIFIQLMKHAHRPMPDDHPEDPHGGPFWKRHSQLDNTLSSAFMFLPERFRLPRNIRDPVAVQMNLNLHAAVICLHNVASEKAEKFNLPTHIKQASMARALNAAREIAEIVKQTHNIKAGYSPFMALSLYCAATAYISEAKDNPAGFDSTNLEAIIKCMVGVGKEHVVTRAYLTQTILEIERTGIPVNLDPDLMKSTKYANCGHGIPLVTHSSVRHHIHITKPSSSSSTRLPHVTAFPPLGIDACTSFVEEGICEEDEGNPHASKRMRTSAGSSSSNWSFFTDTGPSASGGSAASRLLDTHTTIPALFGYPGSWGEDTAAARNLPYRTEPPQPPPTHNTMPTVKDFPTNLMNLFLPDPTFVGGGAMFPSLGETPPPPPPPPLPNASSSSAAASSSAQQQHQGFVPDSIPSMPNMNMDIFDGLGQWEMTDPDSFYAMLANVSGVDNTNNMNPWNTGGSNNNNNNNNNNDNGSAGASSWGGMG